MAMAEAGARLVLAVMAEKPAGWLPKPLERMIEDRGCTQRGPRHPPLWSVHLLAVVADVRISRPGLREMLI
jgi:hypothetical protein